MCNHYRVDRPEDVIGFARAKADALDAESWVVTADAWPKTAMPVVYHAGQRTLAAMRWGVWPRFDKKARFVVNARDDQLLANAVWKQSVAERRCLVPADGFCEWTGPAGGKWEVLFHRPERRPFFFAGIWSQDPAGDGRGFAIVTGAPNPLLAALPHDRMPVLLDGEAADAWLGAEPLPAEKVRALCTPYAGELIRFDLPKPVRATTAGPVTDELPLG